MAQTKVQLLQPDLGDVIDFDSSTLFMDGTDNRVGIRNTNPQYELDVTGTVKATNFIGSGSTTIADWIVHDGDTNTKIGFSANDTFQVQTGGSGRVTVTDSATTVDNDLRIVKSSGALLEVTTNTGAADATLRLSEGATGSTTNGGGMFYSGADNKLYITCGTNSTTKRITVDRDTGKVGIGEVSPDELLHIASTGTAKFRLTDNRTSIADTSQYGVIQFEQRDSNTPGVSAEVAAVMQDTTNGNTAIQIKTGTPSTIGERFRITGQGKVNVGGDYTQTSYQLSVTDTGGNLFRIKTSNEGDYDLRFMIQNSESNIWHYGTDDFVFGCRYNRKLHFITNAQKRITINGDLVGINQTAPAVELDVKGATPEIRLTCSNAGLGQGDTIGQLGWYTTDPTTPSGVGTVSYINTYSATSNGSDYTTAFSNRAGAGGGETKITLGNALGQIRFYTHASGGGQERLRIDSSGQMGLGMTATRMFEVKDSTGANRIMNIRGTGTSGAYLAFLDANTTDDSKCRVGSSGGNNLALRGDSHSLQDGAGNNRLVVLSSGHVNIGGNYTQTNYMVQVAGDLLLQKAQAAYQHPQLEIYNSNNSAHGGSIKFSGYHSGTGGKYQEAVIKAYGGVGANTGSLVFVTGNNDDKMRMHADGSIEFKNQTLANIRVDDGNSTSGSGLKITIDNTEEFRFDPGSITYKNSNNQTRGQLLAPNNYYSNTNQYIDLTQWRLSDSWHILEVFGTVNPNSSGSGAYVDPCHFYIYRGQGWDSGIHHWLYCASVAPPARHAFPSGTGYAGNAGISAVWYTGSSIRGNKSATSTDYVRILIPNANAGANFQKNFRVMRRF